MPISLITWFFVVISGCVQQTQGQQHNLIQLQLSIIDNYNLSSADDGAVLEEQESEARVSNHSASSSVGLGTSTDKRHDSSEDSLLRTSTERDDSGDSSSATTVTQLSSAGDKPGASTPTQLNKDEVEIGTASLPHSVVTNTTASTTDVSEETTTGNLNGSSSSASFRNDSEDVVTALNTNASLKTVTAEVLYDVESTASSSTSEGATTLIAKVVSASEVVYDTTTMDGLTTGSKATAHTETEELGTTTFARRVATDNISSSSSAGLYAKVTTSGLHHNCSSSASAAEVKSDPLVTKTTYLPHMNATPGVNSTGALDSLGKVDFTEPWRIWRRATGVLAVIAILLLVVIVMPMIFQITRRYMLRHDTFTGIPGDVEFSELASSESSRDGVFSAEQAAVITRPSSEIIEL